MIPLKHYSFKLLSSIFVLLFFTSFVPNHPTENHILLSHKIKISGSFNYDIIGEMYFVESTEINNNGIKYNSLTLKLENSTKNKIALLIAQENVTGNIQEGVYKIVNENANSENHTNGLFGYYNNVASEELPFFTEDGEVVITKKTNTILEGYLQLNLKNTNQKRITISGRFLAKNIN